VNLPVLGRGLSYSFEWAVRFVRPSGGRFPSALNLPLTDNCNSRCVMCDIWKTKAAGELTSQEYRTILSEEVFSKVRHVGVSGGEPTLRKDFVECIRTIVETLPLLRSISITTHGFHTNLWRRYAPELQTICSAQGVALTVNVSLDGVSEAHDRIRGIPGHTSEQLRQRTYYATSGSRSNCTAQSRKGTHGRSQLYWMKVKHSVLYR